MAAPSSNWLALKKKLVTVEDNKRPKKRRKLESASETASLTSISAIGASNDVRKTPPLPPPVIMKGGNPDSIEALQRMVRGEEAYADSHLLPGKYVSMDCEMVGVAEGSGSKKSSRRNEDDESSLARVSVVNYHGVVLMDEFVRQRERVTDWRTAVSGVRPSDMTNGMSMFSNPFNSTHGTLTHELVAKPFMEIQKQVADLLKDRILVGHAVHNDLQCLLLSHPQHMVRDTQFLAGRHGTLKQNVRAQENGDAIKRNKKWSLRNLVSYELGMQIQSGEHSSVTDARATMAIYRIHKKLWDKGFHHPNIEKSNKATKTKRKLDEATSDDAVAEEAIKPSKNPKGISSGLSVVVNRQRGSQKSKQVQTGTKSRKERNVAAAEDSQWWTKLG